MDTAPFLTLFGAMFAAMLIFAAAQNVYTVGDGMGWDIPRDTSVSYANWASGKTFLVGDVLVFNFVTNQHDLVEVTKASYDACDLEDNEIGSIITTGPANVTLNTTGDLYYICTFGRHCAAGQKLAITVGSSTPGSTNPPMTAPPITPATPSPDSSQPDPCAPVPSPSLTPNAGSTGPTAAAARPPPPPDSASASLASGFLLVLLSIGVALIV